MKKIFYIFIFLLFSNNIYAAQDREEELNKLFNQLKNTYNNLSAKEYNTWIKPLQYEEIDNCIKILAPNSFVFDILVVVIFEITDHAFHVVF